MTIICCMVPEIWSMKDRIFVILGHFLPFYPTNNLQNQNFEKMKKHLEISSFYTSVSKLMIICHTTPEIWYITNVICIFHFGLFFALTPTPLLLTAPKNVHSWNTGLLFLTNNFFRKPKEKKKKYLHKNMKNLTIKSSSLI